MEPTPRKERPTADKEDIELVESIQHGDGRSALDQLVKRHQERVKRRILGLAGASGLAWDDAQDVLQNALLKVVRAAMQYDIARGQALGRPFRAYLDRTVTNSFKDFARGYWRVHGRERALGSETDTGNACTIEASAAEDPVAVAEGHELAVALHAALNRLSPRQLWLVEQWMADRSFRDLARELGVWESEVRRCWIEVLRSLRADLERFVE